MSQAACPPDEKKASRKPARLLSNKSIYFDVPVEPPVLPPLVPEPLLPAPLGEVVLLPLLGEVVLLPDVPPALELPLAPLLLPVAPLLLPVAPLLLPEPLVMPSSFRHFSRASPTMPRHLLLVPPAALPVLLLPDAPDDDAPPEALSDEPLLPDALGVELLLGLELLLPDALGVELLLGLELLLLPDALGVEDVPLLCANDTLDSAKSAAAVAALMSFRVI